MTLSLAQSPIGNTADVNTRVLIVDDDPDLLASFEDLLDLETNYQVFTATNARKAEEIARRNSPQIALIDVMLGSVNGLDLIPRLKQHCPEIICIVMTASRLAENSVQAVRSGADEFLYKPLEPENLLRNLDQFKTLQRFQHETAESNRRFRSVFNQTFQLIFLLDAKGALHEANATAYEYCGELLDEAVQSPFWKARWWNVSPGTAFMPIKLAISNAVAGEVVCDEVQFVDIRGNILTMDFSLKPIIDDLGMVTLIIAEFRDITERKRTEEKLRLASKVIESTAESMIITDNEGTIIDVNPAFCMTTGYCPEEVLGQRPNMMKSDCHDEKFYRHMWTSLLETGQWQGEIWDRRKNGEIFPKRLSISAVRKGEDQVSHYIGVFSDISKLKETQQRLQHLAYYDALTDLPNRALFIDRLQVNLTSAARHQRSVAVLFVDLDGFKFVNDTLGHRVGDVLLVEAARRQQEVLREADTVARLGGDEFTILLSELASPQTAETVARRVVETLAQPFFIAGQEICISASVGVALSTTDGTNAEKLLRSADAAMYSAKQRGKNNYQFFDIEMETRSRERLRLETGLRHAIPNHELFLHYQPKLDLNTLEVVGVEALLRWRHPELGLVPPAVFIPVAEETGLIVSIGKFVLREACLQAKVWQQNELAQVPVAVNISPRQFHTKHLVKDVCAILEQTGLAPTLLELELTESLVMDDIERNISLLKEFKALGIRISIDDFGTGYSSLSYLKRLPVDTVKIDKSFVSELTHDHDDNVIVSTIIAMANNMHINVIAEGVETTDQFNTLKDGGCNEAQGYLFSKPVSGECLESAMAKIRSISRQSVDGSYQDTI